MCMCMCVCVKSINDYVVFLTISNEVLRSIIIARFLYGICKPAATFGADSGSTKNRSQAKRLINAKW